MTDDDEIERRATAAGYINPATELEPDADPPPSARPEKGTRPRAEPLVWSDFLTRNLGEVEWLPGRLMARGQQVALVGEGKVGKSLLSQEWAYRMAAGKSFLTGPPAQPVRVLYVDQENGHDDIQARLLAYGAHPVELANLIYLSFPPFRPLDTADGGSDLIEAVEQYDAEIVFFDTVSRMIKGKENDADTWLDLYRHTTKRLKSRRIASVRLDHMGKDTDRGARGSSAKTQDVDHVWELAAQGESTLRLRRTHTRTGIGEGELYVTRHAVKVGDQWKPGGTYHALDADEHGAPVTGPWLVAQGIAAKLDAAGEPDTLGRDLLRAACARLGIKASNDVLSQVASYRKGRNP